VRPFSTEAWRASVVQAIEVARAGGLGELVFTTGGRTERFAMQLLPGVPELAFVQVGDDVALGLTRADRLGVKLVTLVAMVGKLAKVAAGALQTHVSRSRVDLGLLASLAAEAGAGPALTRAIAEANTARHALELADAAQLVDLPIRLCRRAAQVLAEQAGATLATRAVLVGFDGSLRAAWPALPGVA
jgi:cobalt-precorrin-5B (C1)-methyltransferase